MSILNLQDIRKQLDQIDTEIVALFEKRMKLCRDVAGYKIENGKSVYDREREKDKLESVSNLAHGTFNKQAVGELFSQMMTISRRYQYQLLAAHGLKYDTGFIPVKELETKECRVVYQGVEGAYSHEAAIRYFGENADAYHVPRWEDAMEAVAEGQADYAVLPIENSSAGTVSDIYDLLVKYHNYIVGELFLPVNHALLGIPGTQLSKIQTVFSHPQALMQCSDFLNSHREWKQVSVENTAGSAKKVMEDGDKTQAAVASEIAGSLYGLEVLQPSINHNKNNTTRFIILAREPVYIDDAKKISICFELPHKSGTLYNMLGNFIYNDVNMFMIESRPVRGKNWEYRFFVDLEGNLSDASVQNALKGIAAESSSLRILGNY